MTKPRKIKRLRYEAEIDDGWILPSVCIYPLEDEPIILTQSEARSLGRWLIRSADWSESRAR
jgi:hypothetical protein